MKYLKDFENHNTEQDLTNFLVYSNIIMDLIRQSNNYQDFIRKVELKGLETELTQVEYTEMKSVNAASENSFNLVCNSIDTAELKCFILITFN